MHLLILADSISHLKKSQCSKVPVILHTIHSYDIHSYFSKFTPNTIIHIELYLARRSTGIIAISDTQKHELANVYHICEPEKIKIIPLGLDLDKFNIHQDVKRAEFRKQFSLNTDDIVIGIIGRVVPVKNHSLFVAAAKKVLDQTSLPVKFVVVGDGDMREQMEAEFAEAGIDYTYYPRDPREATASCISWQTEMDYVLSGLDIVELTSHNEGTTVSLIEAQAASKPVVSTNVGGVKDVVTDNQTGYITEPGDADTFAEALLKLINNPEKRNYFGQLGKTFAQTHYSYQRLVRDMSDFYYDQLALAGVDYRKPPIRPVSPNLEED